MEQVGGLETLAEGLFFEDLLAQAVEAPSDEQAQAVLRAHVAEVIESGDLRRIQSAAMVMGATACMHPHLESLANMLGEHTMPGVQELGGLAQTSHDHSKHDGHEYGPKIDEDDDEDDEDAT